MMQFVHSLTRQIEKTTTELKKLHEQTVREIELDQHRYAIFGAKPYQSLRAPDFKPGLYKLTEKILITRSPEFVESCQDFYELPENLTIMALFEVLLKI